MDGEGVDGEGVGEEMERGWVCGGMEREWVERWRGGGWRDGEGVAEEMEREWVDRSERVGKECGKKRGSRVKR